ncbi:hypothetical protein [uncultured Corynebacterium sp.]|mgnify:FL=1|uniref:hypothetical protein n=1 Tax=uncultured Corynebacterium sp. TaxID=159447 RepID=UPI0025E439C1|nr:hypothetical protein [uncultured Corynebacterium sp.]
MDQFRTHIANFFEISPRKSSQASQRLIAVLGGLLVLVVALFLYSQYEVGDSWPSFDSAVRDLSAITGVALTAILSDSITRYDVNFINSNAYRKAGLIRLQFFSPAIYIIASYLASIALFYFMCRGGDAGGDPWYLGIASGMAWVIIVCPAISVFVSLLLQGKRSYSLLSSIAFSLSILVASYFSNLIPFLPRLGVFWTDNFASSRPWAIGAQGSQLSLTVVAAVLTISLLFTLLTWLAFYARVLGDFSRVLFLLAGGLVLTLGSGVLVNAVSGNSSILTQRPSTDEPICIEDHNHQVRFCGWPEDGDVIERMDASWSDYVDKLNELGVPLDSEVISVQGVLEEPNVEISGISFRSTSSAFKRSTTALLNEDIQECSKALNPSEKVILRQLAEYIADRLSADFGDGKGNSSLTSNDSNLVSSNIHRDLTKVVRAIEDCNPSSV